jgi:hypothetical protein
VAGVDPKPIGLGCDGALPKGDVDADGVIAGAVTDACGSVVGGLVLPRSDGVCGDVDGCAAAGASSFIAGSGGSSGMAGTAGRLSLAIAVTAGEPTVGGVGVAAAGAGEIGGGVVEGAVEGHAGAALSAASDAPFEPVSGGTPSGDWLAELAAARVGTGPSLIFMYKYTPTPSRMVIVKSGRIEPIDRPP